MWLIGLDFGSTTSSALFAPVVVLSNCVTGRSEWRELAGGYRPEPAYTPFLADALDEDQLAALLDRWLRESGVTPEQFVAGGAIVTGLAAQAGNAAIVARLVRERIGRAVIATADDPSLESWLAFMGNSLACSRSLPDRAVVNLDIGGGTTNVARGLAGEVRTVGCYFIGARHVQCAPGTYRIERLSPYAARLFHELEILRKPGDSLRPDELARVMDFYVSALEATVTGDWGALEPQRDLVQFLEQVPFRPSDDSQAIVQFSGGVGELIYRLARGESVPGVTAYGDLGIDLARRIVESPLLSRDLTTHTPETLGRATVYGLALHNTELSGATLFLPRPEILPLPDLPIIGRLTAVDSNDSHLNALLELAKRSVSGAAVRIEFAQSDMLTVKRLGERIATALASSDFPHDRPLVLLVSHNVGKTLGQYATSWGRLDANLIVADEIPDRGAHFVSLGAPLNNLVPVSFYGIQARP